MQFKQAIGLSRSIFHAASNETSNVLKISELPIVSSVPKRLLTSRRYGFHGQKVRVLEFHFSGGISAKKPDGVNESKIKKLYEV